METLEMIILGMAFALTDGYSIWWQNGGLGIRENNVSITQRADFL